MLTFKRLTKLMGGAWIFYVPALIVALVQACTQMVGPLVVRTTLDSILGDVPLAAPNAPAPIIWVVEKLGGTERIAGHLWIATLALFIIAVINGAMSFLRGSNVWRASETMAEKLKNKLYDHLQKLPYDYHIKAQTGDLIQRCTSDVETIRRFIQGAVFEIVRPAFMITVSFAIMVSINVKLALLSIVSFPVLVVAAYVFFRKIRSAFLKSDEKEGELSAALQENLSGVRVVRAFGRQKFELDKFEGKNKELRDLNQKLLHNLAIYWGVSDLVCMTQISLTMLVGVYFAYKGDVTVGTVVLFTNYIQMLVWPVRQMGRFLSDAGKMQVSIGRVYEILDTPQEKDSEGAVDCDLRGDIVFEDVVFGYEKDKNVLDKMSFTVKQGETIAVLGATGSGKSSLMHILLKLYDYSGGSVKINGTELSGIKKECVRSRVGMVLQEPFLFSRTIKENVKMARYDAEDAEIENVAKTAAVHDDIAGFEKGYDTIIGEKGVTLSGGQKQRVAIARTLIRDSDILIFDDSLSAVDTETDAKIRAALKEREHNATTFIISQRITTLMQADRIFVMENGKLADEGTHAELAARDGLYSRIWAIQSMLSDDFDKDKEGDLN